MQNDVYEQYRRVLRRQRKLQRECPACSHLQAYCLYSGISEDYSDSSDTENDAKEPQELSSKCPNIPITFSQLMSLVDSIPYLDNGRKAQMSTCMTRQLWGKAVEILGEAYQQWPQIDSLVCTDEDKRMNIQPTLSLLQALLSRLPSSVGEDGGVGRVSLEMRLLRWFPWNQCDQCGCPLCMRCGQAGWHLGVPCAVQNEHPNW